MTNIGAESLSPAQVRELLNSDQLVVDIDVPAAGFGMSRWAYYEAVKRGDAPVMPIRVGRRQRYRVSDLRRALGLDAPDASLGWHSPAAPITPLRP